MARYKEVYYCHDSKRWDTNLGPHDDINYLYRQMQSDDDNPSFTDRYAFLVVESDTDSTKLPPP